MNTVSFSRRTLVRHATIVTMDDEIGDLSDADLLVEDGRIAAVGPTLAAGDGAEIIDATGCLVIPGLVNAHMHTWQTALRGMAANWTLPEYFRWVHAGLATAFTPDDIRVGTLAGALNQINWGTTTLVDGCHNNPTPAHTLHDFAMAAELGLIASVHHGGGLAKARGGWARLMERGFVGPRTNIVHGNDLSNEELAQFVALDTSFSVTPEPRLRRVTASHL